MPDLYEVASIFRTAIEEAVRAGEIPKMASFPCGCCSYASDLLQRYLIEQYGMEGTGLSVGLRQVLSEKSADCRKNFS